MYPNNYGVRCQISGVSKQMTEVREQRPERLLDLPFVSICLLSSDVRSLSLVLRYFFADLTPDT